MKNYIILFIILALIIVAGSTISTIAILDSDLPDIWKWFLLK